MTIRKSRSVDGGIEGKMSYSAPSISICRISSPGRAAGAHSLSQSEKEIPSWRVLLVKNLGLKLRNESDGWSGLVLREPSSRKDRMFFPARSRSNFRLLPTPGEKQAVTPEKSSGTRYPPSKCPPTLMSCVGHASGRSLLRVDETRCSENLRKSFLIALFFLG